MNFLNYQIKSTQRQKSPYCRMISATGHSSKGALERELSAEHHSLGMTPTKQRNAGNFRHTNAACLTHEDHVSLREIQTPSVFTLYTSSASQEEERKNS